MIHFTRICSVLVLLSLAAACGDASDAGGSSLREQLSGATWTVASAEGTPSEHPFQEGVETFVVDAFADDLFVGFNGCKNWNAEVVWSETSFVHPPGADATAILEACDPSTLSVALELLVKAQSNAPVEVEFLTEDQITLSAGDMVLTANRS